MFSPLPYYNPQANNKFYGKRRIRNNHNEKAMAMNKRVEKRRAKKKGKK